MAETRRVLITGVSRFWGGQLAKRLESDPSIERIVAIDTRAPVVDLGRTDFLRADIRHSLIGKLVRTLDIDTVVHAGLIVDPRAATARVVHETNVIGTMNLIAACSGVDSPVRKLVVKSSTAIYGSEGDDPSFWSETMVRTAPARGTFTRDLDEVEGYVRDFQLRKPDAVVTVLRFANVLGPTHSTPFSRLFELRVVPTVFGFDPRLQFLHEFDAAAVLEHAVRHDRPGVFNVAGDGIVLLSQAITLMRRTNLPILPFVGAGLGMAAFNRVRPIGFPEHLVRLLQFGRVVDTTALRDDFGASLQYSTRDTVVDHAQHRAVRGRAPASPTYRYDEELEQFLQTRAAAWNGHHVSNGTATRRRGAAQHRPARKAT